MAFLFRLDLPSFYQEGEGYDDHETLQIKSVRKTGLWFLGPSA